MAKKKRDKKKFRDTAIGKFLTEKAPDLIGDGLAVIGDLTGKETLENLGKKIAGSNDLSEEDKAIAQELIKMELAELELAYADTANARNREIEIIKSGNANWITANAASIIAFAWTIFTFVLFVMALAGKIKAEENIQFLVINSSTGFVMLIVGYYFGSSSSSAEKNKWLDKSLKK